MNIMKWEYKGGNRMLTEKDCEDLIDKLYPYFAQRIKKDDSFINSINQVVGTVVEVQGNGARAKVNIDPFGGNDKAIEVDISPALFKTGYEENAVTYVCTIQTGDQVYIQYSGNNLNTGIITRKIVR